MVIPTCSSGTRARPASRTGCIATTGARASSTSPAASASTQWGTTRQAAFLDYDNDGDTDFFVAFRDRAELAVPERWRQVPRRRAGDRAGRSAQDRRRGVVRHGRRWRPRRIRREPGWRPERLLPQRRRTLHRRREARWGWTAAGARWCTAASAPAWPTSTMTATSICSSPTTARTRCIATRAAASSSTSRQRRTSPATTTRRRPRGATSTTTAAPTSTWRATWRQ